MKDNNVILEVKDLHKSFGEQEVLKGISTEVNSCLLYTSPSPRD